MPSRTICSVMDEMRVYLKLVVKDKKHHDHLLSLVEESQTLANRMEAAIWDQHTIKSLQDERQRLKKEINDLEQKIASLKVKRKALEKPSVSNSDTE